MIRTGIDRALSSWKKGALILLAVATFVIGCATGSGQPHMETAIDHLRAARADLEAATADKGGHRVNAIRLVDSAIYEVERGIAFRARR
jgi:hypothetical protein